jgi:thioesterase domain-containing protein/acyl carrier protein
MDEINQVFDELRLDCRRLLADYMVPQHFIVLDEIPLSANGKVQKEKLPTPAQHKQSSIDSSTDKFSKFNPRDQNEILIRRSLANVLNIDEETICCQNDTFFDLGGNSLTAIQLIFSIREACSKLLGIQDLFNAPTVSGIHDTLYPKDSSEINIEEIDAKEVSSIQLLRLNKGNKLDYCAPVILMNPAGASGLCYLELVKSLDGDNPIFVCDDGVMSNGKPFIWDSIEEVAQCCMPLIQQVSKEYGVRKIVNNQFSSEIILAGWSYGGVIVSEIAKIIDELNKSIHNNIKILIKVLILFDSPLRERILVSADSTNSEEIFDANQHEEKLAHAPNLTDHTNLEVAKRTEDHFSACTALLKIYQKRVFDSPYLNCPVVDIQPEESEYIPIPQAAEELTTDKCKRIVVKGDHWTMLFGNNTRNVADIVKKYC